AYVLDNSLIIYNISNPVNPYQVGSFSNYEVFNGIAVSGDYAYVTYLFDTDGVFGIRVIDVSNPMNPIPCGSIVTPGGEYAYSLEVSHDYLYLANGIAGLQVIDISDSYDLEIVGFYSPSRTEAKGLDVIGGRVYMADENYLRVLDFLPVTAVEPSSTAQLPTKFGITSAYPNPFNPLTNISFDIPAMDKVSLIIYDIQGREIARLLDGLMPAGTYLRTFDGSGFSSGTYYAIFSSSFHQSVEKLVLIK
ncbi:hypothetical protein AMJ86_07525, partial [bacterium SM23_57]